MNLRSDMFIVRKTVSANGHVELNAFYYFYYYFRYKNIGQITQSRKIDQISQKVELVKLEISVKSANLLISVNWPKWENPLYRHFR